VSEDSNADQKPRRKGKPSNEASPAEKKPSTKPAKDAKDDPADLQEDDQGAKPGKEHAAHASPDAPKDPPAKGKHKGEEEPQEEEGDSDPGDEAPQDEGLHDDFFRAGEEVEKQHIAQAASGPEKLEDTGESRLATLRSSKQLMERRKKMRKIVAYILAPAALIALIAGVKAYNGGGSASAGSQRPIATVTAKPTASPAEVQAPSAGTTMASATPETTGSASDESPDAEPPVEDAGAVTDEADASPTAPEADAPKPDVPEVPEGVDARKEALKALEQGKWAQAITMSQAALAKDPEDATLYLYYGTALQESGRRPEANKVFKDCVANAKRGPITECRMFAR
jgi:tetratricopeptide (TPR) repeat protein